MLSLDEHNGVLGVVSRLFRSCESPPSLVAVNGYVTANAAGIGIHLGGEGGRRLATAVLPLPFESYRDVAEVATPFLQERGVEPVSERRRIDYITEAPRVLHEYFVLPNA